MEGNVLSDFVVEVAHVLSRMTHTVLVKTFGAVGVVPQVRVSEATERMVSRLVCSGVRVDIVQLLESLVQMATDDVRWREWFGCN